MIAHPLSLSSQPIVRVLLIDIDGTLVSKGELIPGADQAVEALRETGFRLKFLTNTDSRDADTLADELTKLGLTVSVSEIVTAIDAAYHYIARKGPGRCYCLMPKQLAGRFYSLYPEEGEVRYVVVGDPRETTHYTNLNHAFRYVLSGAEIVAAQRGRFFISQDGYQLDTGPVVALLEYATGKQATLVGKPEKAFFDGATSDLDVPPEQVVVVGDDVTSDILGAAAAGMRSVLTRTGKYAAQRDLPITSGPDWTINSIADLPALVEQMRAEA